MIRFMVDTWRDALLRPLAMAAPNSSVYIELMAPDFRFVLALGLAALAATGMHQRTHSDWRPVFVLFGLIFLSFVPWIATSGNGRYFMPYLALIGPLCISLINMLSCTRGMKAAVVALVLGLQGFALYQNNPWKPYDTWGGTPWRDAPYYSIDIDPQAIEPETTYITVTDLTMSLLAPQFPAASRWVNLSIFNGSDVSQETITYAPVQKILQSAKSLKLFQRSAPSAMLAGNYQPNQAAIDTFNAYLLPHRLAIRTPTDCKLLSSRSPSFSSLQEKNEGSEAATRQRIAPGFWVCSLQYPIAKMSRAKLTAHEIRAEKVFGRMETLCPGFFPPGQTLVKNHLTEHSRAYPGGDSQLILKHNGDLYVQIALALNPEKIGHADEVLSDRFRIDCTQFKGRVGLPWEREI